MKTRRTILAGAALVIGASSAALAGVADSPAPSLGGAPAVHVFSVPGVQSTTGGLGAPPLETEFFCTSLESSKPIHIAVEVFNYSGGAALNDVSAGNGAATAAPGQTVTISTGQVAAFLPHATITGLTPLSGTSARIVSTSKRIMCSAVVVDGSHLVPTSMVSLQVIKLRTQRGN